MEQSDYEQLVFCHDKTSGLKAIICIHDSTLGPSLGGCRFWNYDTEEEAIVDVMRLAKGMTYKNAAAGLNLGGAKTVVIGDPKTDKSEAFFRALGRYINSLDGRYITAEDVGTSVEDMDMIYQETPYVCGVSELFGSGGNPLGVYYSMKRTAKETFGNDSLESKTVAVQGAGNVAYHMCKFLLEEGANLIVTDVNEEAVKHAVDDFNAKPVNIEDIYGVEADIFAPCALGGVINVSDELQGYNKERATQKVKSVYNQIGKIFNITSEKNILPLEAAEHLSEEHIEALLRIHSKFSSKANNQINK